MMLQFASAIATIAAEQLSTLQVLSGGTQTPVTEANSTSIPKSSHDP